MDESDELCLLWDKECVKPTRTVREKGIKILIKASQKKKGKNILNIDTSLMVTVPRHILRKMAYIWCCSSLVQTHKDGLQSREFFDFANNCFF